MTGIMELPEIMYQDGCKVGIRDTAGHDFEIIIGSEREIEGLEELLPMFVEWLNIPVDRDTHNIAPEYTWDSYLRYVSPWSYSGVVL